MDIWQLALARLNDIPDYRTGALITLNGETRLYWFGKWAEVSFAELVNNMPTLTADDLFPIMRKD